MLVRLQSDKMRRFLIQSIFLFLLSLGCGIIFSFIHANSLMIFESYRPGPEIGTSSPRLEFTIEEIGVETLRTLLESDQIILLDARDPDQFALGHIPSALNFPIRSFDSRFREWMSRLNPEQMIVTYCSEATCLDSQLLAEKLFQNGFERVAVFRGGMTKWKRLGYRIDKGAD